MKGALSRYTKYSIDGIANEVIEVFKKSLEDAVFFEANVLDRNLNASVRNVTMDKVYSYEPTHANKLRRRYFHDGGLGDPDNYGLEAFKDSSGNFQVIFSQKKTILPQGNTSGEGIYDTSGDEGVGAGTKLDLRYIVENAPPRWHQPYERPYFEDIAHDLMDTLPDNIQRRLAASMRMQGM